MTSDQEHTPESVQPRRSARLSKGKGKANGQNMTEDDFVDADPDSGNEDQSSWQKPMHHQHSSLEPSPERSGDVNGHEIKSDQIIEILKAVKGHNNMPIPLSRQAPRFNGKGLWHFLEDYSIAADGAGWSNEMKCNHLPSYCGHRTRVLVKKLPERKKLDWEATKKRLISLYIAEEQTDKYSRDKLNRYVKTR